MFVQVTRRGEGRGRGKGGEVRRVKGEMCARRG